MPTGGQITIAANLTKDELGQSVHLVHLELRITREGGGIPEGLLNQMFGNNVSISEERNGLLVRSKLVKLRNGDVMYLREAGKATFMISVELAAILDGKQHRFSSVQPIQGMRVEGCIFDMPCNFN
ncbi:hypothetical protein GBA52_026082 [Prunus armeniaca]|nr:hypothetical protein GBA52_026082 [Prunus armeniaca]